LELKNRWQICYDKGVRLIAFLLLFSAVCLGGVRITTDAQGRKAVVNSGSRTSAAMLESRSTPLLSKVLDSATWSHIYDAARANGLDPELVAAVIKVESGFNPNALSRKGARGLMQLMPATARLLGLEDAFDGRGNIHGGCRYLKSLLDDFEGDLPLALAAYNAGRETVRKYNGIPPYPETRNYVRKVLRFYNGDEEAAFSAGRRVRLIRDREGRLVVTNQRR